MNHNGGSIFDQNSKMGAGKNGQLGNIKNYNIGIKSDSLDPADVLVENEMLRSELQKMHEKMKAMEKVSNPQSSKKATKGAIVQKQITGNILHFYTLRLPNSFIKQ